MERPGGDLVAREAADVDAGRGQKLAGKLEERYAAIFAGRLGEREQRRAVPMEKSTGNGVPAADRDFSEVKFPRGKQSAMSVAMFCAIAPRIGYQPGRTRGCLRLRQRLGSLVEHGQIPAIGE